MSRAERDKDARRERQIVAAHVELCVKAERVPLSRASRYHGNGADAWISAFSAAMRRRSCSRSRLGRAARASPPYADVMTLGNAAKAGVRLVCDLPLPKMVVGVILSGGEC
jgi:hypothetical protein